MRWGFLLPMLLLPASAIAAQSALINVENSSIYSKIDHASEVLEEHHRGDALDVSSGTLTDRYGHLWHKTKTKDGRYGYVPANDLLTGEHFVAEKALGVAPVDQPLRQRNSGSVWNFSLRGMGMGGYEAIQKKSFFAGEGELVFNLFFSQRGYSRRRIAAGVAYQKFKDASIPCLGLVYRLFTEGRMEPEFRVRVGRESSSGELYGALIVGVRYPLTLSSAFQISASLDLGGGITRSATRAWGAAGIGFLF